MEPFTHEHEGHVVKENTGDHEKPLYRDAHSQLIDQKINHGQNDTSDDESWKNPGGRVSGVKIQGFVEQNGFKSFPINRQKGNHTQGKRTAGGDCFLHFTGDITLPFGCFDFRDQPVADVKQNHYRYQHDDSLYHFLAGHTDIQNFLKDIRGDKTTDNPDQHAHINGFQFVLIAGFDEECDQRRDDQNRLKTFPHNDRKGLDEQTGKPDLLSQNLLRLFQVVGNSPPDFLYQFDGCFSLDFRLQPPKVGFQLEAQIPAFGD